MDTSPDVDIISTGTTPDDKSALDERKLAHVAHETGVKLQSHSSVIRSTAFRIFFECSTYQCYPPLLHNYTFSATPIDQQIYLPIPRTDSGAERRFQPRLIPVLAR